MANNKLTQKQKIFVNEYLATTDLNVTAAYKKAYTNVKNDDVAAAAGSRLLRNVKIKEYVDKRMRDREIRTEITQDKVLQEIAAVAFANGTDFAKIVKKPIVVNGQEVLNEDGSPKTYEDIEFEITEKLSKNKRKAIASISYTKNGIKVETCNKLEALKLLGSHLGLFKDKVEVSGSVDINNPYKGLTTEELLKIANDKDG